MIAKQITQSNWFSVLEMWCSFSWAPRTSANEIYLYLLYNYGYMKKGNLYIIFQIIQNIFFQNGITWDVTLGCNTWLYSLYWVVFISMWNFSFNILKKSVVTHTFLEKGYICLEMENTFSIPEVSFISLQGLA